MTGSRDSPGRGGGGAASTSSPLQSASGDVKANYEAAGGRNGGDRATTVSLKTAAMRELGAFNDESLMYFFIR